MQENHNLLVANRTAREVHFVLARGRPLLELLDGLELQRVHLLLTQRVKPTQKAVERAVAAHIHACGS